MGAGVGAAVWGRRSSRPSKEIVPDPVPSCLSHGTTPEGGGSKTTVICMYMEGICCRSRERGKKEGERGESEEREEEGRGGLSLPNCLQRSVASRKVPVPQNKPKCRALFYPPYPMSLHHAKCHCRLSPAAKLQVCKGKRAKAGHNGERRERRDVVSGEL